MVVNMRQQIRFDPEDRSFVEDPYPFYRRLREEAPVFHDQKSNLWLVTRYRDIGQCLANFGVFSSARGNAIADLPQRVGRTLGSIDPPRHDELRRIIQPGLNNARIEALAPVVREEVRQRLASFGDVRQCDAVADIGKPILFAIIGRLLGLEGADSVRAAEMASWIFHHDDGPMGAVMAPDKFKEIFEFLREKAHERTRKRGDDVISALLDARDSGASLTEDEIVANMTTVLLAGNASAGHFFANMVHALWLHPDQRKLVIEDRSLLASAIEEGVRWDTSTQCFARQTTMETSIGDTVVPADSRIVLFYASANRDERVIQDAENFDIGRKKVRHFGFGQGPHICGGAFAARVLLHALFDELLSIVGEYDLDLAHSTRVHHLQVRGFTRMPISW